MTADPHFTGDFVCGIGDSAKQRWLMLFQQTY